MYVCTPPPHLLPYLLHSIPDSFCFDSSGGGGGIKFNVEADASYGSDIGVMSCLVLYHRPLT